MSRAGVSLQEAGEWRIGAIHVIRKKCAPDSGVVLGAA